MPTIRNVRDFRGQYWRENAAILPSLAISIALIILSSNDRGLWFWVGCFLFVGSLGWGVVLHRKWFYHFECPQCKRSLPVPPRQPHEPIRFTCEHCDIIWDTGFKEPSDD
jgi:hypothetical protein